MAKTNLLAADCADDADGPSAFRPPIAPIPRTLGPSASSAQSVDVHKYNLMRKIDLHDRAE